MSEIKLLRPLYVVPNQNITSLCDVLDAGGKVVVYHIHKLTAEALVEAVNAAPRPEPEPRKTCGGCAYYEPHEREERGGCTVPIPFWALPTKWVSVDATDCPCYVPKGE